MNLLEVKRYLKQSEKKGILAIDPGMKKIGLAWADYSIGVAVPISVIKIDSLANVIDKIKKIISEKEISFIVMGFHSDSRYANDISVRFKKVLAKHIDLPIFNEDESFSTKEAQNMLKMHNIKHKKIAAIDDMVAAMLILEAFLNRINN